MIFLLGVALLVGSGTYANVIDIDGRIAGGKNVTAHVPYVARITTYGPHGEVRWFCNGAIINTTIILTTASCMFGSLYASVMAGSSDQGAEKATNGSQWSNSTQIYLHPDFKRNTYLNDIAIIRVYPPFNTTETVNVINLAKSSVIKGDALANKTAMWVSYGQFNKTSNATGLMYAEVKAIKSKACEAIYKPGPYFIALPKTVMCMEPSTTIGMCMGDAGSMVIYMDPKEKKIVPPLFLAALAIQNVTETCPPNGTLKMNAPLMFTRIDPHYKWILSMGGPKQS